MFSLTRESKHIKAKEGNPLRSSINQSTALLVYTNDALWLEVGREHSYKKTPTLFKFMRNNKGEN